MGNFGEKSSVISFLGQVRLENPPHFQCLTRYKKLNGILNELFSLKYICFNLLAHVGFLHMQDL